VWCMEWKEEVGKGEDRWFISLEEEDERMEEEQTRTDECWGR